MRVALSTEKTNGLLHDIKIYNNIVYANTYNGIIITDYDQDGPKQEITIVNNTVYSNGYNSLNWGGGILVASSNANNSGLVVRNNICSGNAEWQLAQVSSNGLCVLIMTAMEQQT